MTQMVSVRIDDAGVLSVQHAAFQPTESVTRQVLPVAGGALEIDVRAPGRGIRAVIDDTAAAAWWLPFVFGAEAAELVATLDDAEGVHESTVPATIAPELDLDSVARRLLVGFWFRRWWPAGVVDAAVDEWLLDAELAILAAEAESLLGGVEISSALLSAHLAQLAAEAQNALDHGTNGVPPERVGVIERAILAATDVADDAAPGFEAIEGVAGAIRAAGGLPVDERPATDEPVRQSKLEGSGGGSPVDWTLVHPRQVSAAADAVRTTVREGSAGLFVDVRVAAPASVVSMPVEPGELYVRVGEGAFAEAGTLDAAEDEFVATAPMPAADSVVVSVASDVYGGLSRAADAAHAAAARVDVLQVVRARLDGGGLDGVASFAFERQLIHDARTRRTHDDIVDAAAAELDLDWLLLSEATFAFRDGTAADAFSAIDDTARVHILLARRRTGWLLRLESVGGEGTATVTVRFASGAIRIVSMDVESDGPTDSLVDSMLDDAPVAVAVSVSPR